MPRRTLPALLALAVIGCAAETQLEDDIPDGMTVEVIRPLVLTDEARVPENDPVYDGVEVHADRLVFLLSGELAEPLEAGHVVAGRGDGGYLREITSVSTLVDGRLEVFTDQAQISQFLADGHIKVHYDPPGEEGTVMTDVDDEVAGRSEALGGRGGGIVLVGSPIGLRCGVGTATDVTLDPEFTIDPEFDAELDLGVDWGWTGPRPKVDKFMLKMGAEVYAGLDIESEGGWDAVCVQDLADLTVDIPLPTVAFAVLGIPVIITNEIEPVLTVDVDARVGTDSYAQHMSATVGLEVGVEYSDGEWKPIWDPTAELDQGVTATDDEGNSISATFRLSAGLEYQSRLYGSFGPNFGLELFVEEELGTSSPEYCDWFAQIDAGLTATFGGEFEINVGPVDWTVGQIQIAEVDLVRIPVDGDSGTFPWCDTCNSAVTCVDDLGREICDGGQGVQECGAGSGYYQACTCTASGLVDCGTCTR
jgi:hypothetical protein